MTTNSRHDILTECNRLDMLGEYDRAMQLLSDVVVSEPDEVAYRVCRGRLLCDRLGRAVEAIDDFKKAIALDARSAIPHQHMALCYLLLNDLDSATSHAEEAVALASTDALSHVCLARCRLHSERFHSAVKHFELALELDRRSALNWSGLAEACRGAGLLEKAEQAHERSVSLEPTPNYYIQLAAIKLDVNKPTEALKALESAQKHELSEVQRTLIEGYLEVAKRQ